jgi:hypothetical protein
MCGIELVQDKIAKKPFSRHRMLGAKVCSAMRPKGAILAPSEMSSS